MQPEPDNRSGSDDAADLLLVVDRGDGRLQAQIEDQLREGIRAGRLRPGIRLPATRDLARSLGVSRGVVVAAYDQLAAEGYLVPRRRGGTFVAARVLRAVADADGPADIPPRYEFRPGFPELAAFPRREWLRATGEVLADLPDRRFAAVDPRGAPELREALASYLGRVRGVVAAPEQVLVCAGFTEAFHLLCRALWRRGARRMAFEEPCWSLLRLVAVHAGLVALPVSVDDHGLRVDELDGANVDAVVVTPAHQFPTGVVLSAQRRTELLEWAERRGALVLEDDYDGEFRFDREPIGALQGRSPQRVVYGGSASKALAPGLRIGWLVAPPALGGAVIQEKVLAAGASPVLTELALARLLERGGYDRHLRRQRRAYRRRRQIVIDVMESEVPGAHVSGVEAGLHALVTLPPAMADDAVVEGAARRGVAIERLRTFAATPQAQPDALVLGYAALAEPTLRAGLAELVAAIEAQAGDGSRGSGRGSAGQRERPGAATETDPSGGAAARRVVDTGGEPVGA